MSLREAQSRLNLSTLEEREHDYYQKNRECAPAHHKKRVFKIGAIMPFYFDAV